MKLLILTQAVDSNDSVLGFFHRWIEEFAKRCQKVVVICLKRGNYNLPENVLVHSLGKERGPSRWKYLMRFYRYLWSERHNYEAVFVHMNSEYVILGWVWWKLWGKKVWLWNNHQRGNWATWLALKLVDRVFYTSPFSYSAVVGGKKGKQMPVGIDETLFKEDGEVKPVPNSLLFLGRISPIKNLETLIVAAKLLDQEQADFVLNIVGDSAEKDAAYLRRIKSAAEDLEERGKIKFWPAMSNSLLPKIYNENEIFINLTNSGSLDKTIMEAIFCGSLVLVSNQSLKDFLPQEMIFKENDAVDLKNKITSLLKLDKELKEKRRLELRHRALGEHRLADLIDQILTN